MSSPLGHGSPSKPESVSSHSDEHAIHDKNSDSNASLLQRAHRVAPYVGGLYAVALLCLLLPFFQRHLLYMHVVNWPFRTAFDTPQRYGLSPFKTLNIQIGTPDDITLGAWLVLSDAAVSSASFAESHPNTSLHIPASPLSISSQLLSDSLRDYPTVLYFHGNAGNRAFSSRLGLYKLITSKLGTPNRSPLFFTIVPFLTEHPIGANVLAIDYRGFGDSTGIPSESGLKIDARAAWDWLASQGVSPSNILIMGQSLGTAVSVGLADGLAQEGVHPRGVTLVAPFSNLVTLLETFMIGGIIPVLRPITTWMPVYNKIMEFLQDRWDTELAIMSIKAPILLVHCITDPTIPHTHSQSLFDSLLSPYLPPVPFTKNELINPPASLSRTEFLKKLKDGQDARIEAKKTISTGGWVAGIDAWVAEFKRKGDGKVMHVETKWGGHTDIIRTEVFHEIVGDFFSIHRTN